MTILLRITCLFLTQVFFMTHDVSCSALKAAWFDSVDDTVVSAHQPQIKTTTKFDQELVMLLYTTITRHSIGNPKIFIPKANTKKSRVFDIPVRKKSAIANSVVDYITPRLVVVVPYAYKIKDSYRFGHAKTSGKNNGNNVAAHWNRSQRKEFTGIHEKISEGTGKIARTDSEPSSDAVFRAEGYTYDINKCQTVDERILCGYDKNPEEPQKKTIVELDDICRKYGDRIECGYWKPPFPDVYNLDPQHPLAKIDISKYPFIPELRSGRPQSERRSRNKPESLLLIFLMSTHIISVIKEGHCAPKLGGVLFEQLLLETFFDNENNTNTYYKEQQAFAAPDSHDNIKNTTSLYAKLTGKSKINLPNLRSENKSKLLEEHKIPLPADYSDKREGNTNTNLSETITLQNASQRTTEKIEADIASDSENSNVNKFKSQAAEKINTPINNAGTPSENSARNGTILQSNGYAFNENLCQLKDFRVLCGYKGPQTPSEPEPTTMFSKWNDKDCILREDRIECGYLKASVDSYKQQNSETTASKILILRNDTPKPTVSSITSTTAPSKQPVSTFTTVVSNPGPEVDATTNTDSESNLAKVKLLELIDRVKHVFNLTVIHLTSSTTAASSIKAASSTTAASSTNTVDNPNLSEFKILKLINKVIASNFTTLPTIKDPPSTPPPTRMKELPPDVHDLIIRVVKKILASSIIPTITTTETNLTTTGTSTTTATPSTYFSSTTTIPPPPTTTSTPAPYIDEKEYCIEKDGRIICYDYINEPPADYVDDDDDDDYLEK